MTPGDSESAEDRRASLAQSALKFFEILALSEASESGLHCGQRGRFLGRECLMQDPSLTR
jgi:hypothetical protein